MAAGAAGPVSAISTDTRTIAEGECFAAIRGERFDGHDYVEEAFRRGAGAAMVSAVSCASLSDVGPLLVVDDTRAGLVSLARGYRNTLSASMIGVTGSVGKTTVKEMIADMIESHRKVARNPGNWNNDIGLPLSLLQTEPDAEIGVFEIGMSHAGEIRLLSDVLRPDMGIVTNVGPAHLEFFDSEADIASEKADLLRTLPSDGTAIIARDEAWFNILQDAAPCPVTTVAIGETADYEGTLSETDPYAFDVRESETGEFAAFHSALPGAYFKRNALLAVASCRRLGVGWDDLVRVVGTFEPEALRWNVHSVGGVTFVDDSYNANPISMRAAIQAFQEMPVGGGRWLVLGGMLELGAAAEGLHRELGGLVASGSWKGLIGYGPWGRHIADGAARAGMPAPQIECCDNYKGVIDVLAVGVDAGDAVLLKASRRERLERVRELWIERCRTLRGVRAGISEQM